MNKFAAALLTLAVTAFYVPNLRTQMRDGVLPIPLTGTIPIFIRRDEHPLWFYISLVVQIALMILLIGASLLLIYQGLEA